MPAEREYVVYILASTMGRLYVGVTNDLERRIWQHRTKAVDGFTSRYNVGSMRSLAAGSTRESHWTAARDDKGIGEIGLPLSARRTAESTALAFGCP
jgi:predicted GIY-YIG superfamily endonuclease